MGISLVFDQDVLLQDLDIGPGLPQRIHVLHEKVPDLPHGLDAHLVQLGSHVAQRCGEETFRI